MWPDRVPADVDVGVVFEQLLVAPPVIWAQHHHGEQFASLVNEESGQRVVDPL